MKDIKERLKENGTFFRIRVGIIDGLRSSLSIIEETFKAYGNSKELYSSTYDYANLRKFAGKIMTPEELKDFDKRYNQVREDCLNRTYIKNKGKNHENTNP